MFPRTRHRDAPKMRLHKRLQDGSLVNELAIPSWLGVRWISESSHRGQTGEGGGVGLRTANGAALSPFYSFSKRCTPLQQDQRGGSRVARGHLVRSAVIDTEGRNACFWAERPLRRVFADTRKIPPNVV
jgi:hypothetical protein